MTSLMNTILLIKVVQQGYLLPYQFNLHLAKELASAVIQARTTLWATDRTLGIDIAVDTLSIKLRGSAWKCSLIYGMRATMRAVYNVI